MNDPKSTGTKAFEELRSNGEAAFNNLEEGFEDVAARLIEVTEDLSHSAMETMKKYPLHTALAAGSIGFLLGAFLIPKK